MAAAIVGFFGVAGFILLAVRSGDVWLGVISLYLVTSCWSGFQQARALLRFAKLPRRNGFACPSCKAVPPVGDLWTCGRCGQGFDTFQSHAICPICGAPVSGDKDAWIAGRLIPQASGRSSAVAPRNL